MFQQAVEIALFPPDFRHGAGCHLLVGLAQFALADRFRNDLPVAGHQGSVDLPEQLRPEFRLELPAERGFRQRLFPGIEHRDHPRLSFPQPFHLAVVERVGCIDGIAHMADDIHRISVVFLFLHREIRIPHLRAACRFPHLPGRLFHRGLQRVHIRTPVRDLTEPVHFPSSVINIRFPRNSRPSLRLSRPYPFSFPVKDTTDGYPWTTGTSGSRRIDKVVPPEV